MDLQEFGGLEISAGKRLRQATQARLTLSSEQQRNSSKMTGCRAKKAQLSALVKQRKDRKENKTTTKKRRTSIGGAAGPGKPVGQHFAQDLISDLEVVGEGRGRFL